MDKGSESYNANNYLGFTHQVINKEGSGEQINSSVAANNNGNRVFVLADGTFAVSWTDTREPKDKPQIWVRGFKADGSELFGERVAADTVAGERIKSDIFMDDSKNIVVTWQDDADGNGMYEIKMRLLKSNGSNKTGVLAVNSDSSGQDDWDNNSYHEIYGYSEQLK